MSKNLKSSPCSATANNSSAEKPTELYQNKCRTYEANVETLRNIDIKIQSNGEDLSVLHNIGRNISRIKDCCEILGESVGDVNFTQLERFKYFDDKATDKLENLKTLNVEKAPQEGVCMPENIFNYSYISSSEEDAKSSSKENQSSIRQNDTLAAKKKKRKREKHRSKKKLHRNTNTSKHCEDSLQSGNLKENVERDNSELLRENNVQANSSKGILLQNKSMEYETNAPYIKSRMELLINAYTQNMISIILEVKSVYFEIEECLKRKKWLEFGETLVAYYMKGGFTEDEGSPKRYTESESKNISALNKQQVENNSSFKDSTENVIISTHKNINSSEIVLNNDNSLVNQKQSRNEYINLSEDKNSPDGKLDESEVATRIQLDVCTKIRNYLKIRSEALLKMHFKSVYRKKKSDGSSKLHSDYFDKLLESESLTRSYKKPFNVDQSKVVAKFNATITDLKSVARMNALNNISRALDIKKLYEEQNSLLKTLEVISRKIEDSDDLNIAFSTFNGICKDSCIQNVNVKTYLTEMIEVEIKYIANFNNVLTKIKTPSSNQKLEDQYWYALKALKKAQESLHCLRMIFLVSNSATKRLDDLTEKMNRSNFQDSSLLIANGIFLHREYYENVVTLGVLIQKFTHFSILSEKLRKFPLLGLLTNSRYYSPW